MLFKLPRAGFARPVGVLRLNQDSEQSLGLVGLYPLAGDTRNRCDAPDATFSGGAWDTGIQVPGLAWRQSGSSNNVSAPNLTPFTLSSEGTFSIWVRVEGTTEGEILQYRFNGSNEAEITNHLASGSTMRFIHRSTSGGSATITPTALADQQEALLTFTWSATANLAVAYINGVSVGSSANVAAFSSPATILRIGNNNATNNVFEGWLYHALFYRRAIAASEVWSLYDPPTRWSLYQQPSTRVWFDIGAAIAAGRHNFLTLLGIR